MGMQNHHYMEESEVRANNREPGVRSQEPESSGPYSVAGTVAQKPGLVFSVGLGKNLDKRES
jgi:hypothetical protein